MHNELTLDGIILLMCVTVLTQTHCSFTVDKATYLQHNMECRCHTAPYIQNPFNTRALIQYKDVILLV